MEYRYLSMLRPLGAWVSIDIPYSLESPTEKDIHPFRPDWKPHDVLITQEPLNKEKIESLQLTDLTAINNAKKLYDALQGMTLNVEDIYIRGIKDELSDKIINGKIKNVETLDKMVQKYVKYCQGA